MTVNDRDIYASAKLFINQHGDDALLESMKKEELLHQHGDKEGARVWHKITNAIEWLQIPENLNGDICN